MSWKLSKSIINVHSAFYPPSVQVHCNQTTGIVWVLYWHVNHHHLVLIDWLDVLSLYVKLLVSQTFGDLLKKVIGSILNWQFWVYCMERNPCLQYKWCTFNLVILTKFAKPVPNKSTPIYSIHSLWLVNFLQLKGWCQNMVIMYGQSSLTKAFQFWDDQEQRCYVPHSWLGQWKPSTLACKFWTIFRCLKSQLFNGCL